MTVGHLEFVFGLIAGTVFGLGVAVCYAAFRARSRDEERWCELHQTYWCDSEVHR